MPTTHYFTVDEANATLPFVRRVVSDIVADYGRWRDALERYELAVAGATAESGEPPEAERLRREVDDLAQEIERFIEELRQVGCTMKAFDSGQVGFPAKGATLSWRLGEPAVSVEA